MADSLLLFDVFGYQSTRKTAKNVLRQPCSENMGKAVLEGLVKPNEPMKKAVKPGEIKKSFLSNAGMALQSTPVRQVFSPRNMKAIIKESPMIYTEEKDDGIDFEEIEFTKSPQRYDMYCYHYEPLFKVTRHDSPPGTPLPQLRRPSFEFASDYDDMSDFSTSVDSILDEDLGLPNPY